MRNGLMIESPSGATGWGGLLAPYGLAPVVVAAAVGFAYLAVRILPHVNLPVVFLIVASRTGRGPGLLAGGLSVLAYNYFVPRHHAAASLKRRYQRSTVLL